jgi:hypothetical protein
VVLGALAMFATSVAASPQDKKPVNAKCRSRPTRTPTPRSPATSKARRRLLLQQLQEDVRRQSRQFAAKIPELKAPAEPAGKNLRSPQAPSAIAARQREGVDACRSPSRAR